MASGLVAVKRYKSSHSILSLGGGVQSSTLLLMACHGEIKIDRAIFADTQWEPRAVYDWMEILIQEADFYGIPVDIVTGGDIRRDAMIGKSEAWMPLHIVNLEGNPGMAKRQFTKNYKLVPIRRRIREMVGRRRSTVVEVNIGISWDESYRAKDSDVQWMVNRFPLIERRMTRDDCIQWLREHGYPTPPKSSCIGCPYRRDDQWADMKYNHPKDWEDAVAFDASPAIRYERIAGEAYLHRSLIPLSMVALTQPDQTMIDDISDGERGAFTCMAGG